MAHRHGARHHGLRRHREEPPAASPPNVLGPPSSAILFAVRRRLPVPVGTRRVLFFAHAFALAEGQSSASRSGEPAWCDDAGCLARGPISAVRPFVYLPPPLELSWPVGRLPPPSPSAVTRSRARPADLDLPSCLHSVRVTTWGPGGRTPTGPRDVGLGLHPHHQRRPLAVNRFPAYPPAQAIARGRLPPRPERRALAGAGPHARAREPLLRGPRHQQVRRIGDFEDRPRGRDAAHPWPAPSATSPPSASWTCSAGRTPCRLPARPMVTIPLARLEAAPPASPSIRRGGTRVVNGDVKSRSASSVDPEDSPAHREGPMGLMSYEPVVTVGRRTSRCAHRPPPPRVGTLHHRRSDTASGEGPRVHRRLRARQSGAPRG